MRAPAQRAGLYSGLTVLHIVLHIYPVFFFLLLLNNHLYIAAGTWWLFQFMVRSSYLVNSLVTGKLKKADWIGDLSFIFH